MKRNTPKSSASDSASPDKSVAANTSVPRASKPARRGSWMKSLTKYLPFLKPIVRKARKPAAHSTGTSRAAIRRAKKLSRQRARMYHPHERAVRVRHAKSKGASAEAAHQLTLPIEQPAISDEQMSTAMETSEKQSTPPATPNEPAFPMDAVQATPTAPTDTPATRSHGLWRLRDGSVATPTPAHPSDAEHSHPREGLMGFFRHLFVHPHEAMDTEMGDHTTPTLSDAAQPTMTKQTVPPVPPLSLDLDLLLQPTDQAKGPAKETSNASLTSTQHDASAPAGIKPETALPDADLLNPLSSAAPAAPASTIGNNFAAGAQTSRGRFVPKGEQKRLDEEALERTRKETAEAKHEKAEREREEAKKREEADKKLAKQALEDVPVELKMPPKRNTGGFQEFLGSLRYFGMGKEKITIVQNLATMLNAGLPLVEAIKTLREEARARPMKNLLGRISDAVENGSPLWRAMEDQHFFSPHAIALIRIGEEAGDLAENMEYLSAQQEKDQALRGKVKMAMIYPSIVMTMMFIVVVGLGWFVLPNLISVLYSLNVELPLTTRLVIAFTNMFVNHGAVVVPSSVGGILLLIILGKFTPLRVVMQWIMFRIPGMGRLAREATIARFGVILGGLLQAGVPLVEAIRSLADVTPIVAYRKFYTRLHESINVGNSFSKSFQLIPGGRKLLPVSVQQLIVTGEKSGSLAKILLKVADIYEKKANDTAQKLPVILEPMILLFIGALVATIAFAIIVPIYSIVGSVGGR